MGRVPFYTQHQHGRARPVIHGTAECTFLPRLPSESVWLCTPGSTQTHDRRCVITVLVAHVPPGVWFGIRSRRSQIADDPSDGHGVFALAEAQGSSEQRRELAMGTPARGARRLHMIPSNSLQGHWQVASTR